MGREQPSAGGHAVALQPLVAMALRGALSWRALRSFRREPATR